MWWIYLLFFCILAAIAVGLYYAFKPDSEQSANQASSKEQTESFVERPRVVVSFSTIPSRLPFLREVSQEILKQTFQPDAIYACIPTVSARFGTPYDLTGINIPENLVVVRSGDYGPATKLLGCLVYEPDPDTIIITIDDDIVYSTKMVETMVENALQNPKKRVGSRATNHNGTKGKNYKSRIEKDQSIVLEGFGAVAYRRSMLTDDIVDTLKNLPHTHPCWKSDDITFDRLISAEKLKIPNLVETTDTHLEHLDALQDDARRQTYFLCMEELDEKDSL